MYHFDETKILFQTSWNFTIKTVHVIIFKCSIYYIYICSGLPSPGIVVPPELMEEANVEEQHDVTDEENPAEETDTDPEVGGFVFLFFLFAFCVYILAVLSMFSLFH